MAVAMKENTRASSALARPSGSSLGVRAGRVALLQFVARGGATRREPRWRERLLSMCACDEFWFQE
jgi:hypothetical protein